MSEEKNDELKVGDLVRYSSKYPHADEMWGLCIVIGYLPSLYDAFQTVNKRLMLHSQKVDRLDNGQDWIWDTEDKFIKIG